jgi:peptidoglycan hydrolase-like protein with peptidoglycan-binding domain
MITVVASVAIACTVPAAAYAGNEDMGTLVEYAMEFPVSGDPWFYDGFWEPREGGRIHEGIDLFADKGTEVRAVATGTILRVNGSYDSLAPEACCSMVIAHDDGWQSLYAHLNNDTPGTDDGKGWGIADGLAPGRRVEAGQLIGYVGDSDNAEETPPHVHLELLNPSGVAANPYLALRNARGEAATGVKAPLYANRQVIKRGDGGKHVLQLQEDLSRIGIGVGDLDGAFGPMTEKAVTAFQEHHRLEPDGLVGDLTRAALAGLLKAKASSLLGFGVEGDGVAETQRLLARAGVDPGPVDGDFGPRTLEAVLDFQKSAELDADGLVGPKTLAALNDAG